MRFLLSIISLLLFQVLMARDTTKVVLDLTNLESKMVSVEVYPPKDKKVWEYVIPEIVPGTYMKINYERFYKKVKAYDVKGNELKVKQRKNVFSVQGDQTVHKINYQVKPSLGDGRIWDNTLVCGGSAYNAESALINFQMVNGYFEGYERSPFKIQVKKPINFYGASSINKRSVNDSIDYLYAPNYNQLIDEPILYAEPDTVSFTINDNCFRIAVYAGAGRVNAQLLKPRFEAIMHAIDTFSGFTTDQDYHLLLYFADRDQLRGIFKDFGAGSALEHKHSSVYFDMDKIYDSTFSYYNWIAPHEYFHTITPLNLHSEKIANFNYRESDMSAHVWMYEGMTDYLAYLVNAEAPNLKRTTSSDMAYAAQSTINREKQSMAASGREIIRKRNIVSFINKVLDIMNFYEKGKIIALGIDIELMERTNGDKRLLDALLEMKHDYEGLYFNDDSLLYILENYTYEGFADQFSPYIDGSEIPPYEDYFQKLGWTFYPKKSKIASYGKFYFYKDREADRYYINYSKGKNRLGIQEGDTVLTINEQEAHEFFSESAKGNYYHEIIYPKLESELKLTVKRNGEVIELKGKPKLEKVKSPKMVVNYYRFNKEQEKFREMFFEHKKWNYRR